MPEKVHYIKSPSLVEIPMHGAYGGVNIQTGQFAMSVFSERASLPRTVEFAEGAEGDAEDINRDTKDGIVRNVTATLYFDINTALSVRKWLDDRIMHFRDAHPELFEESEVQSGESE